MEVLTLDQRGSAAALGRPDHPPVRHQDLAGELAVAAGDPERTAERVHGRVDRPVEVAAARVDPLLVDHRRHQDRQEHPVARRLTGLARVLVESVEELPEEPRRVVLGRQGLVLRKALGSDQADLGALLEEIDVGRENVGEDLGLDEELEAPPGGAAAQQLVDLLEEAGARALGDVADGRQQRLPGLLFDREVEAGGELDRPDHPHRVLLEAECGVADRPDHAAIEVRDPVDEVDDPVVLEVVEETVDREVAAASVVFDRPPLVVAGDQHVVALGGDGGRPEGARLDDLRAEEDVRQLEAAADDPRVAERLADLLGRRAGGDVEVLRAAAEVEVAYAAADEIGLVAVGEQLADYLERVGVDLA